ncbi:MAG: hypothetical protein ACXWH7_10890, partial [Thermoanaerobaculia bacterium]
MVSIAGRRRCVARLAPAAAVAAPATRISNGSRAISFTRGDRTEQAFGHRVRDDAAGDLAVEKFQIADDAWVHLFDERRNAPTREQTARHERDAIADRHSDDRGDDGPRQQPVKDRMSPARG